MDESNSHAKQPHMKELDGRMVITLNRHKVSLNEQSAFSHWDQIHAWWCKQHVINPYDWLYVTFYFDDSQDALMFSLTWGGA
jgi:uncharacterized protein YycO